MRPVLCTVLRYISMGVAADCKELCRGVVLVNSAGTSVSAKGGNGRPTCLHRLRRLLLPRYVNTWRRLASNSEWTVRASAQYTETTPQRHMYRYHTSTTGVSLVGTGCPSPERVHDFWALSPSMDASGGPVGKRVQHTASQYPVVRFMGWRAPFRSPTTTTATRRIDTKHPRASTTHENLPRPRQPPPFSQ